MKLTLKATRVYATKDQFGPVPRTEVVGSPIAVSFPSGDRGLVTLGPPPDWTYEARRITIGVGSIAGDFLLGGQARPMEEHPDRVREVMAELEPHHRKEIEDFNFFTTIVVERDLEVSDDQRGPHELVWWDWRGSEQTIAGFELEAKDALDHMAVAVALRLSGTMPGTLLFERTYFTAEGHPGFAMPRLRGGGADMHTMSPDRIGQARLKEALDVVAASQSRRSGLPQPAHWYLAARAETDPWKRFLWACFALERLINDAFDVAKQLPNYQQLVTQAKAIDPKLPSKSIRFRLAVVGIVHSPATAAADVAELKTLYDARSDLAHGTIASPDGLPTAAVLEMLERYLRVIIGI